MAYLEKNGHSLYSPFKRSAGFQTKENENACQQKSNTIKNSTEFLVQPKMLRVSANKDTLDDKLYQNKPNQDQILKP